MSVRTQLHFYRSQLPETCRLVAVSKLQSQDAIIEAYAEGQRDFGENYVQELLQKQDALPKDIRWHFIGHLQTNKVKQLVPFVHMIHSVDSARLLDEIQSQAVKKERRIKVLLQVFIAKEETKFGWDPQEVLAFIQQTDWKKFNAIDLCGLMGMASLTDNEKQIASEFDTLRKTFEQARQSNCIDKDIFTELSCGMSSDFRIALRYGSTMVRIGSSIFGERMKKQV
jgi:pyridoxal phosphate enzyme (YggS family)